MDRRGEWLDEVPGNLTLREWQLYKSGPDKAVNSDNLLAPVRPAQIKSDRPSIRPETESSPVFARQSGSTLMTNSGRNAMEAIALERQRWQQTKMTADPLEKPCIGVSGSVWSAALLRGRGAMSLNIKGEEGCWQWLPHNFFYSQRDHHGGWQPGSSRQPSYRNEKTIRRGRLQMSHITFHMSALTMQVPRGGEGERELKLWFWKDACMQLVTIFQVQKAACFEGRTMLYLSL